MALDNLNNWSPLPYTFNVVKEKGGESNKYRGELLLEGDDEKKYLFILNICEEIPHDEAGNPTLSLQNIKRKKGILYSITIDSIENSGINISTSCNSLSLEQIVSQLATELSIDIESRYNPLEEKNNVSLFIDLARKRALEALA